jgi:acetyltransferase-like isoleucine patch superfamily enzyme
MLGFGLSLTERKSLIKKRLFRLILQAQEDFDRRNTEEMLSRLRYRGARIQVPSSVRLTGAQYIEIGDDTVFQPYSRMDAVDYYIPTGQKFHPRLSIGARCSIEFNVHIGACYSVEIGDDVMIAGRVYISDHVHNYADPAKPVSRQPLSEPGRIVIGSGSHIGEGVCIFPNVSLGEHVVVGANAVVTKDIPAFCVAAGVPARILRHYDFERRSWEAGAPMTYQALDVPESVYEGSAARND